MWMVRNRSIFLRYDIAHIHDPLPLLFWYLPLIILKPNARRYATFHGFERDPIPLHFKLIRKIARRLVQGVICIGNWISTEYGIECDGTTVGAVEPLNLECKTRSGAVFVGRLETDTGLLEYIDSLHILKVQHDIDLNMVVCGSGSLRQQALDLAHTKSISTDFRGFVPNPREVMNACQVCLAAGYLSILEAMSLGLPVVGFSKTPLRYEYLKTIAAQGGPISIQSSPEGVAQEIAKIIKKPDLSAKMGEKGKAFAAMMSWQRMTEMYLRLWV
jgi:glycosyltransferase involved in cell wall biosynthesis